MAKQTAVLSLATLFLTVAVPASAATGDTAGDSSVSLVLPEATATAPAVTGDTTGDSTVSLALPEATATAPAVTGDAVGDSTVSLVLPEPTTPATTTPSVTTAPSTAAGPTRVYRLSPMPTVDVVTLNGSGCPADTGQAALSADSTSFEVTFSEFSAVVTADSPQSRTRKNCVVGLTVDLPEGYTFAVREIPVAVDLDLAAGARLEHRISYYFSGNSTTTDVTTAVDGPFRGVWRSRHLVSDDSLVWLPCGQERQLNLNHRLVVLSGTSAQANSARMSALASPRLIWASC
jgi:hypothetical protein